ncbi:MAG: hypothetical protein E3K37_06365 [Candidatus Kuenenia sp.]|nr:hypothetical protein [Candidatus Kuenenia hertensis]
MMEYQHPIINNIDSLKTLIGKKYYYLGKNKQQEISRLIFEIAKREKVGFSDVLEQIPPPPHRFSFIKNYLLERRYPSFHQKGLKISQAFCDVDINPSFKVDLTTKPLIVPKQFFIEKSVLSTDTVQQIRDKFPDSTFTAIESYRDHVKNKEFSIIDYNKRLESFYIIREKFDFYKHCPCSNDSASCGYYVMNLGSGCPYECVYCFLQNYVNSPGIMLPANIEDFFAVFRNLKKDMRLGSGEFTDSLAFDHIMEYSPKIVNFFRQYPKSTFEFKTKSNNIQLLTSLQGTKNIIISWSLNPQKLIDTAEFFTASLDERLEAAQKCIEAGYRVAFHFDPIVCYRGWETDYELLINAVFDKIGEAENMAWLSLGTLRVSPQLKKIIENRFPETTLLDEELLTGFDGKLRYPTEVRSFIYNSMTSWIRKKSKNVPVYLCMEDMKMHRNTQLSQTLQ